MFRQLDLLPSDPLLGLIAKYQQDNNPQKVDLGVGVYKNEEGNTPVLESVKKAEHLILETQQTKAYLGAMGDVEFNRLLPEVIFGADHSILRDKRLSFLQTPGGCGALRVGAELIARAKPSAKVWVSDPTWANHVPLLSDAGLKITTYPYYDVQNHCILFEEMLASLEQASAGDIVLLHGCCHNPCGADLSEEQWRQLAHKLLDNGLIPMVDLAYQGFGTSLEEDAYGIRLLANDFPEMLIAISCSKNFGLYRERVGAVGVIAENRARAEVISSHLNNIVRGIYSMPPGHGAAIVKTILSDHALRDLWQKELIGMRSRIQAMRNKLCQGLEASGAEDRFGFIRSEKGMFSFLGLNENQVKTLADDHSIFMAGSSRINLAGLNQVNLDYCCQAIRKVLA